MSHSKSMLKMMHIIHQVQHKVIAHYSFIAKLFVFHNVWLFAQPTSTMHSMNIDFKRLQCSQRLIFSSPSRFACIYINNKARHSSTIAKITSSQCIQKEKYEARYSSTIAKIASSQHIEKRNKKKSSLDRNRKGNIKIKK